MVKGCCVLQCTNSVRRQPYLSYYMIPSEATEPDRRQMWLLAINRTDENAPGKLWKPKSDYTYVCSAHFVTGKKVNKREHPDYVPSIFPHKPGSRQAGKASVSRFNKAQKRGDHARGQDPARGQEWTAATQQIEGLRFSYQKKGTFVCSRHFNKQELWHESTAPSGGVRLKHHAVPSTYSKLRKCKGRSESMAGHKHHQNSPDHMASEETLLSAMALADHDYTWRLASDALDAAVESIQELDEEVQRLKKTQITLTLNRWDYKTFCLSDDDLSFYTRFPSRDMFYVFWEFIQPSQSLSAFWLRAQSQEHEIPGSHISNARMKLIDELFLYCCRVAAGLTEKVLSDMFQLRVSTVRGIIVKWASYLCQVLGSLSVWMTRHEEQSTMPPQLKQRHPEVRVVIDLTEIKCQSPASPPMVPYDLSGSKSKRTLRGLVGIAPCGVVMFVSSLYIDSISEQELVEQSGILDLLEPGDGCLLTKEVNVERSLATRGAILINSRVGNTDQLISGDTLETKARTELGTLATRVMRRVKAFQIWDSAVPYSLFHCVNQLWTSCCLMTNFQGALD